MVSEPLFQVPCRSGWPKELRGAFQSEGAWASAVRVSSPSAATVQIRRFIVSSLFVVRLIERQALRLAHAGALEDALHRIIPFVAGVFVDPLAIVPVSDLALPRLRVEGRVIDRELVEQLVRPTRG